MGKYNDFQNDHSVVTASASVEETGLSAGLDTKGMEQVTALAMCGLMGATDTIIVTVQDSDDDGSGDAYADLAGATFTTLADADDMTVILGKIKCNTAGVKRWLRVEVVSAGALTGSGSGVLIGQNLSGHLPLTVNALPAPVFNLFNP